MRGRSCEARPGRHYLPACCSRSRQNALLGHAPRDVAQNQPRLHAHAMHIKLCLENTAI